MLWSSATAQNQFDEVNLVGEWTVSDLSGDMSNDLVSFEKIYFGDIVVDNGGDKEVASGAVYGIRYTDPDDYEKVGILMDFFISNGNKLHVVGEDSWVENYGLRFIINSFTDTELKLSTYDGKCSFTLTKTKSAVTRVEDDSFPTKTEYYDTNGRRLNAPQSGLTITRKGREVKKTIR